MTAKVKRTALPNSNRKEISILDLFDFVTGSHLAQQEDPIFMLIVPCGHLIQSQQHGAVISFWVATLPYVCPISDQASILMNRKALVF